MWRHPGLRPRKNGLRLCFLWAKKCSLWIWNCELGTQCRVVTSLSHRIHQVVNSFIYKDSKFIYLFPLYKNPVNAITRPLTERAVRIIERWMILSDPVISRDREEIRLLRPPPGHPRWKACWESYPQKWQSYLISREKKKLLALKRKITKSFNW